MLTGSEQFRLSDAISQSLAGRTALLHLLPFSYAERRRTGASDSVDDILYSGFYPRIHDRKLEPRQALGDYFETYVERDVRRIGEIRNLANFRRFVRLCRRAGRATGQSFVAGRGCRRLSHYGKPLAYGPGNELRCFPAPAVSRQPPQAAGQDTQALLLRCRAGQPPHPESNMPDN